MNKAEHPERRQAVHQLAGRTGRSNGVRRGHAGAELAHDLHYEGLPSFVFPQKGTKYMDTYDYKFVTEQRDQAQAKVRELLGA